MKEIIRYQAKNGVSFETKEECLAHEKLIDDKTFLYSLIEDVYIDTDSEDCIIGKFINAIKEGKITLNIEVEK